MSRCDDPDCGWCESTARNLASIPKIEETWWTAVGLIAWMRESPDGQLFVELTREVEHAS